MVRRWPDRRLARLSPARKAPAHRSCGGTDRCGRTDKDGIIPGLLAAEITARTGRDPGESFSRLTDELGVPFYERIDAPATPAAEGRC